MNTTEHTQKIPPGGSVSPKSCQPSVQNVVRCGSVLTSKIPPGGSVFAPKYPLAVQEIPLGGSVLGCKPASVKGENSLKAIKSLKGRFTLTAFHGVSETLPHNPIGSEQLQHPTPTSAWEAIPQNPRGIEPLRQTTTTDCRDARYRSTNYGERDQGEPMTMRKLASLKGHCTAIVTRLKKGAGTGTREAAL
jgi:hypothetical protein